jgi:glycogen debranching enzyme
MADALVAAIDWTNKRLDANKEGLLEFKSMTARGLENQAWKDSWDAYFHKNGEIANHQQGIASIEVQRVTFDALLDAADFYQKHFAKHTQAQELRNRAEKLRLAIMEKFWTESQGGYFVLGTDRSPSDGGLRRLEIRTSNMGHMLHSLVLLSGEEPEIVRRREALIAQLFSPEMLNVSGIRTLATDEFRFRPGAYHNGSVWLWDSYLIAQGLDLHGYHGLSYELQRRILNVITTTRQYPEFVRGDNSNQPSLNTQVIDVWDEKYQRSNRLEQPSQEVQAWTVAAILSMQQKRKVSTLTASGASELAFEQKILKSLHN